MKEIQWLYLHSLYSKTCPTGGAGRVFFIAINYEFDNCTESYNVTKANDVSDKKMAGNECKTKLCNNAMSLNLQLLNRAQVFCSIYHFKVDTGKCCLKSIDSSQFVYPAGDIFACYQGRFRLYCTCMSSGSSPRCCPLCILWGDGGRSPTN